MSEQPVVGASARSSVSLARVEARRASKLLGNTPALAEVSVVLRAGRPCALLGPNGAGKSTLIKLLASLLRPSSGEVRFERDDGTGLSPLLARASTGLLAHDHLLYGDLTALENLLFYAELFAVANPEQRIRELADALQLVPRELRRPVRFCSRGTGQRFALMRALLHQPRLVLLDEPFSGLDVAGCTALLALLEKQRQRGCVMLIATHDFAAIDGLCHQMVVLRRGAVVLDETRDEPYDSALLADRYRAALAAAPQTLGTR
ncbi:MAG: ABC transporter ATP-binding protein [Pseudomonadota bacterium]